VRFFHDRHARGRRLPLPVRGLIPVVLAGVIICLLQGCGPSWSPVERRSPDASGSQLTTDGNYRVRRGDSLYTIAFNFGLDWRDIADWNGIAPPYVIYPDQELRVSPPPRSEQTAVVTRPAQTPKGSSSRDGGAGAPASGQRPPDPPAAEASEAAATPRASSAPARTVPSKLPDPGAWLWPTEGRLISGFKANDPARNGIDIGGREGQPVIAAAAGEVVYSGSGLIGYGELIIIKHSDRMLSAYAHNKRRLVAEGQAVAAGETVAEMGRNDRNQAMLHFEIRVNGAPQDPIKYLPSR
jgi:lipoprotein NlpD